MKNVKSISLCPECEACPEVTFQETTKEVWVGEKDNLVKLDKSAWNTLVGKILAGELTAL